MEKTIRITYPNGEMNIDLLPFIAKHNINDIRFLAQKVIAISPHKHETKREILDAINEIRDSDMFYNYVDTYENTHPYYWQRDFMPTKDWQMYNKRLDRLTEFLDRYVKD
jgi:hypothetical protein